MHTLTIEPHPETLIQKNRLTSFLAILIIFQHLASHLAFLRASRWSLCRRQPPPPRGPWGFRWPPTMATTSKKQSNPPIALIVDKLKVLFCYEGHALRPFSTPWFLEFSHFLVRAHVSFQHCWCCCCSRLMCFSVFCYYSKIFFDEWVRFMMRRAAVNWFQWFFL